MERSQFTFYASFFQSISRIKKKADRCDAYDAICGYALTGELPNLDSIAESAAIVFDLSKPNLDASRRKAESGKAGGKLKQNGSKTEAKRKQGETVREKEKEKEKEKELEKEKESYSPPVSPSPGERTQKKFVPPTLEEVSQYCRERNSSVDPKKFWEYFDTGKWVDSEGKPVKNWKQKLLTWEKFSPTQKEKPTAQSMNDETYKYIRAMYQHKEEP